MDGFEGTSWMDGGEGTIGLPAEVATPVRSAHVHVAALRKNLGKQGEMIETVRGVGYRMKE